MTSGTLVTIIEAGVVAIAGIIGMVSECRKDEKRSQLQQKIDDAERELKRLDSTDFRLK